MVEENQSKAQNYDALIDEYLLVSSLGGLSPKTINGYRWVIHRFIKSQVTFGDPFSRETVINFLQSLGHLSPSSKHRYFQEIRQFTNWLLSNSYIQRDPFIGLRNVKVPVRIKRPFTEDEIQRLIQSTKGESPREIRDNAILHTLLDTGIRLGELIQLNLSDISIDSVQMVVRKGKGGHSRFVAFGVRCSEVLSTYLELRGTQNDALFVYASADGPLETSRRMNPIAVHRTLLRLGHASGVKGVHAHRFRHSFATWALKNNAREIDIMHLLGHRSTTMLMRYTQTYRSEQARVHHADFSPADSLVN